MPGLFMPNYIYSTCGAHFLAAGELNKKAEASVFEDTGLMALVCRHDRPLFMVTLQDPGERQYNVIALAKRYFKELPPQWRVGFLYDIGCQLHQSIIKASVFFIMLLLHLLMPELLSITSYLNIPIGLHGESPLFMHSDTSSPAKWHITLRRGKVLDLLMGRAAKGSGHLSRS